MTKYNTGNAVGSSDPRDLFDNAQNADNLENGAALQYPDRLGRLRKSRAGMEKAFDDFLSASGYAFLGDYAAGIELTAYNQVIREAGEFWRAAASTELPYNTTGAGMPEGGAFVSVGDASLRQDLAGDPGDGLGAAMVNGTAKSVASRTQMKAYDAPIGTQFVLKEGERSGRFVRRAGVPPVSDPYEGVYVVVDSSRYDERIIQDEFVRLHWFGVADGDNLNDEYGAARQICINLKKDLYIKPGSYTGWGLELIPGQKIVGAGSQLVSIDAQTNGGSLFLSPAITETTLTQSTDLLAGEISHAITNSASAGDFIRFKSTRRFTEEWDGGTEIRPSYVDGELLSIYSATASNLTFNETATLNFPLATSDIVSFFTPHKKGGIFGLKLKRTRDTVTPSNGVYVDGFNGFAWDDIETENFNTAGIGVYRSLHIDAGTLVARGGTKDLGLDYGLSINDGTKFLKAKSVYGTRCRHAVAGGGTGYAVPMYNKVDHIIAESSYSHGADAHGNTAYFTYDRVDSDTGISVSGIGHHVGKAVCKSGFLYLAYEGGADLTFGEVIGRNIKSALPNKRCHRVNINLLDIETAEDLTNGGIFKSGSSHINIQKLRVVNPFASSASTMADANAASSSGWLYGVVMAWDDSHIGKAFVEGFPIGLYVTAKRCTVDVIDTVNCAWSNDLSALCAAIMVSKTAEGSSIKSGNVRALNTNIGELSGGSSYICRVVQLNGNGIGSAKRINITNINTEGSVGEYYYGMSATADYTELFLKNNRIDFGSGGNSVLATGKFIYNTVVADN